MAILCRVVLTGGSIAQVRAYTAFMVAPAVNLAVKAAAATHRLSTYPESELASALLFNSDVEVRLKSTNSNRLIGIVIFLLATTVAFCQTGSHYAQDARQQAWTVLNAGLADKNPGERTIAARVLGLMTNDPQAPELAMQALSDPKAEVRAAAADALRELNYEAARPKIRETLLRNDEDPLLVLACARALLELGDEEAYAVYYAILTGERKTGLSLTDSQKKNLSDPKKMAQMGFQQGLGFVPFASLGYGAVKAVTKDDASPVQATAARMLIKDPDPKTKEALINALNHKSWIVRMAAVDALARRDDPTVIPQLESRLTDAKDAVRYTAAAAIIRLADLHDKSAQLRPSLR